MAVDSECGEDILFLRACSDIMNDERPVRIRVSCVRYNPNMRKISWKQHGDEIACLIFLRRFRNAKRAAVAAEEHLQIGYTAMVDVAVGFGKSPAGWITCEILPHVFVHKFLQIKCMGIAIGTDHNIGADAALAGHVSSGIFE